MTKTDSFSRLIRKATELHRRGKLREAEAAFSSILKAGGTNFEVVAELAEAADEMGEAEAALQLYRRAAQLAPQAPRVLGQWATLLARLGKSHEAIPLFKKAAELAPDNAHLAYNLGKALSEAGFPLQAVQAYQSAIRLDCAFAKAHANLGNALAGLCRHDEAAQAFQAALRIEPGNDGIWSSYLFAAQYADGVTAAKLFDLGKGFEERIGRAQARHRKPFGNARDPNRRLRIGFVSGDFVRHPISFFLEGYFARHDSNGFSLHAYYDNLVEDEHTRKLKSHAASWTTIYGMNDHQLFKRIRSDGIDILFDMAGHTACNRLNVFAMKPAPIQATWAGYVGTTGLTAMDGLIADRWYVPQDEDRYYTEKVIRLPDAYVSYSPPDYAPQPRQTSAARSGRVTFGCFNNPAKLSNSCLGLWWRILSALPDSRLLLHAPLFRTDEGVTAFQDRCKAAGLDPERVDLRPGLPHRELLDAYNGIDIALDPYPYSGGLTTAEALWMGVPVVTLTGATFAGRHSTSYLCALGLEELVAQTADDYLRIATALASDPERLQAYKSDLRGRMAASALLDHDAFAKNLESRLRSLWQDWCILPF